MKILSYIFFFLFCILFVDNFFFNPINEIFIIINCYNLYDIYDGWKKMIRRKFDVRRMEENAWEWFVRLKIAREENEDWR